MKKQTIFTLLVVMLLAACSEKIVGTWNVEKYETMKPGNQNITLTNVGSITFNKDNTGAKNINYQIMGVETLDDFPFTWNINEGYITIESVNSELSKTWIILEDKGKIQKWKSTDGSNQIQTLVLKK